jgi:hypothetical protein
MRKPETPPTELKSPGASLAPISKMPNELKIGGVTLAIAGLLLTVSSTLLRADGANMRREGPLSLNLGSTDRKGFYAACIDPSNGFAYFGSDYAYKVDIRGPLPVQVGPGVDLLGHQSAGAAMDVGSNCAYFASGANICQILANGTNAPSLGAVMEGALGYSEFAQTLFVDESDPANHYLYVLTESNVTSSTFYKIALNQFPSPSSIIGTAFSTAGQPALYYGAFDLTNRFAYFGPLLVNSGPWVVKFALGNGALGPTNMGGVQLDTNQGSTGGMALDIANACGYVCSDGSDGVYGHGRVYKFALNGSGAPSFLSYVDMHTNEGFCHVAIIKPDQGLFYCASDLDYPAKVFRYRLNPGANPPVETGYLPLLNTTNAAVPAWATNPTNSSDWGEVFARSIVYDPVRDFAYIGRDFADAQGGFYTNEIVKVALDRDEMLLSLTPGVTTGAHTIPYSDSFESYSNGSSMTTVAGWFADDAMMGVVTNYDYSESYTNGFPIFGPHTLALQVVGAISNRFASSSFSNVWLDAIVEGRYWTDPILLTLSNAQFALCVTTNGHLAAWNCTNPPAPGNGWTEMLDTSLAPNQFARVTVQALYNRDANAFFYFRVWLDGAPSVNPQTWFATADPTQNHFGDLIAQGHFILDDLVVTSPAVTITHITRNADGSIRMSCQGMPSLTHRVWASGDLSSPVSWQVLSTNLSEADGSWQFTDQNAGVYPERFYRATLP